MTDSLPCYLKRLEPVTKPHVSLGTMYFAFDYQKSLESAGIVVAELNCEIKMDETPLCMGILIETNSITGVMRRSAPVPSSSLKIMSGL